VIAARPSVARTVSVGERVPIGRSAESAVTSRAGSRLTATRCVGVPWIPRIRPAASTRMRHGASPSSERSMESAPTRVTVAGTTRPITATIARRVVSAPAGARRASRVASSKRVYALPT
jgi:hypothetical protein